MEMRTARAPGCGYRAALVLMWTRSVPGRRAVAGPELVKQAARFGFRQVLHAGLAGLLADQRVELVASDAPAPAGGLNGAELTGRDPLVRLRRTFTWTRGAVILGRSAVHRQRDTEERGAFLQLIARGC